MNWESLATLILRQLVPKGWKDCTVARYDFPDYWITVKWSEDFSKAVDVTLYRKANH